MSEETGVKLERLSSGRGWGCDTIEEFRARARARGELRADKETQNDGDEASPCRRDFGWGSIGGGVREEREIARGKWRANGCGARSDRAC